MTREAGAGRCRAVASCALDRSLPASALETHNSPRRAGLRQCVSPLRGRSDADAAVPSRSATRPPVTGPLPLRPIPGTTRAIIASLVFVSAAGCALGSRPNGREIVWEGNVVVREDVVVAKGETLVVRPGTRVTFAFRDADGDGAGDARVLVKGAMIAAGTEAAPIEFVAERDGAAPGWKEILAEDAARAEFSWCRFRGAQQAVHAHRTLLVVERCRFEQNGIGVRFTGGPVAIRRNRFAANGTAIRYWESSPEVTANEFEGNGTALFVREGSARTVATGNNFLSSLDYHVKLGEAQAADVDARQNWWGTAGADEIERLIFDRRDADYLGRVRYDPPAAQPLRLDAP